MNEATLVDTNVLLDVLTDDPTWSQWSSEALRDTANRGPLSINQIIYAEVSVGIQSIEELERLLPRDQIVRENLPWSAGFLADKAFLQYKRAGGKRTSPIADFYIGAHAAVTGKTLLTRDKGVSQATFRPSGSFRPSRLTLRHA